jgi:hypothetical protein
VHVVVGVVQPALTRIVSDRQPGGPDDGQHGVARAQLPVDSEGKPLARGDAVAVTEHLLRAETAEQRLPEAARLRATVVAPITDEDAAHLCPPPVPWLQVNGEYMRK